MNLIFELSKEHKTLPKAEIVACLDAEHVSYNVIDSNENIMIIKADIKEQKIKRLAHRISMSFFIDELLFSSLSSIKEIKKHAEATAIEKKGSIAIRCKNRSDDVESQPILHMLAEVYSKDRKVILENPDIEIRCLIDDEQIYVGSKLFEIDRQQFEKRKVQYRPFFSPISIHPKLARALVNLSRIKKDELMLDPFCGTGGMLIEAGLIGAKIVGSDIENKMIEGCKKTLDFYKIKNYKLFCSDIGSIKKHVKKVDAVVTDLPYGKSTTTKGEEIKQLYGRAFENISKVLKKNGRAVVGLSNKDMMSLGEKYFSLVDKHEFRVHRSLTRYFAVYQN
jgi:tRNA (guanine10-N2)-dimethyltransferase